MKTSGSHERLSSSGPVVGEGRQEGCDEVAVCSLTSISVHSAGAEASSRSGCAVDGRFFYSFDMGAEGRFASTMVHVPYDHSQDFLDRNLPGGIDCSVLPVSGLPLEAP